MSITTFERNASIAEMAVEMDRRGAVIEKLETALSDREAEIKRLKALLRGVNNETGAEIERLKKLVYVPGMWRCAKCSFTLLQRNLNASDGSVTARDKAGDKCPNDGSPLWRVTERDAGNEMIDRAEEAFADKRKAEADLAAATARAEELEKGLREAIELADEGWSYADKYFHEKWQFSERADALRSLLTRQEDKNNAG